MRIADVLNELKQPFLLNHAKGLISEFRLKVTNPSGQIADPVGPTVALIGFDIFPFRAGLSTGSRFGTVREIRPQHFQPLFRGPLWRTTAARRKEFDEDVNGAAPFSRASAFATGHEPSDIVDQLKFAAKAVLGRNCPSRIAEYGPGLVGLIFPYDAENAFKGIVDGSL